VAPMSHAGKVEQGGGDMDRNQVKRWREQDRAVAHGEEGGRLGLNPNRPPFIPLPYGTRAGHAAVRGRLGHGNPRAHQPESRRPSRAPGRLGRARPPGPRGLGHTVLWTVFFYFYDFSFSCRSD
jgi:hypothetical protein